MFLRTSVKKTASEVAIASKEIVETELKRESHLQPVQTTFTDASDLLEDHIFCALLRNFATFDIPQSHKVETHQEVLVECTQESKTTLSQKSSNKDLSIDLIPFIDKKGDEHKKISRASTRASTRAIHLSKRKSKSSRSTKPPRKSDLEEKVAHSLGGEEEEKKPELFVLPPKEDPFEVNFDHVYDVTGENRDLLKHLMENLSFDFLNGNLYEGNISFICKDGRGVYHWSDGSKFNGKFIRDLPNGYGCMEWSDGDRYEGYFSDGLRNGSGSFTIRASTMNHLYSGYWLNGLQSGKGTLKFSEKNWYEGNFENGLYNGTGKRTYPSGGQYIGRWKNGQKNGQGIMLFFNNDMYIGEWVDGKMEGTGKYVWETFYNDQFVYPMHNTYVGQWKDGQRNGYGSLILSSGAVITTLWKDNVKHGWGKLLCTNGTTIECDPLFINDTLVSMKSAEYRDELISEIDDLQNNLKGRESNETGESDNLRQWKSIDCIFEPYKSCTSPINLPPYFMNIDGHIEKLFLLDNWIERVQVLNWCSWSLDLPPWCNKDKNLNVTPVETQRNKIGERKENYFDKTISSKTDLSKDSFKYGKEKGLSELTSSDGSIRNLLSGKGKHWNSIYESKTESDKNSNIEDKEINSETASTSTSKKRKSTMKQSFLKPNESIVNSISTNKNTDSIIQQNITTDKSYILGPDFFEKNKQLIYKFEKKWLRNTIIKHMSTFRKIYNRYATICCKEKPQFECGLLRVLLWKLLKDVNFGETGFSLVELDEMAVGKTDPFDFVSVSEMIHYLLILAWELYTKKNQVNNSTPGLLASGFDLFVLNRLNPILSQEETYEPLFPNCDMIPLEALYRLFQSLGQDITIKTLVHRLLRKSDRNYDKHNIFILPEPNKFFIHTLKGQNGILPGGEIIYRASKPPEFHYIPEEFRQPPEIVKTVDLDFLGTLGNDSIVECVVKCFPQVTNDRGEILQQNYKICFLEFLDVLTECINEYLVRVMKYTRSAFDEKKIKIMDKCLDAMLKEAKSEHSESITSKKTDLNKETTGKTITINE